MQKFNLKNKRPSENTIVYAWLNGQSYGFTNVDNTEDYLIPFVFYTDTDNDPDEPYDFMDLMTTESIRSMDGYDIESDLIEWSPVLNKQGEPYTEAEYEADMEKAKLAFAEYYEKHPNTFATAGDFFATVTNAQLIRFE